MSSNEGGQPTRSNRPFFIVCAGRSGSTLLRLMVAGHSRLHVCPETWFIADLVKSLDISGPLPSQAIEQAIKMICGHYRWPDLGLSEPDLRTALAALDTPSLRDIIDAIYALVSQRSGKPRIGDKTPVYVRILPTLAVLYPDAQFIHLVRDGRDVALSYFDAGWHQRCHQGAAFEWTQAVRCARAFGATAPTGSWLEIHYEDLISCPDMTLRRLCAFLGEDFEPAMLHTASRASLVPQHERAIHTQITRPIMGDHAGSWRKRLSAVECLMIESCLAEDLATNGYELRFGGRAWRPLLTVIGCCLMTLSPFLLLAIPALRRRGLIPNRFYA